MIRREITQRLKSILIWSAAFAFFIIGGMTKFSVFSDGGGQDLNQFVQALPRLMRVIYGMEGVDISTFTGYFGLLLLYVLIMAGIQGSFLGVALIHLEFKERTADFLFVKPRSRARLLLHKLLGGLGVILILEAVITACCYYVFSNTNSLSLLPKTLLAILLTHLFYYALGFLLTILLPKSKMGQQASLVYLLLSYVSISLSQLYDLPWLVNISPVGWFNVNLYGASDQTLLAVNLLLLVFTVLFLALGILRFNSKDIPS